MLFGPCYQKVSESTTADSLGSGENHLARNDQELRTHVVVNHRQRVMGASIIEIVSFFPHCASLPTTEQ
jgi:hypothetical protein